MTPDDHADFELLGLANEKNKFAAPLGRTVIESALQDAFERGIDGRWFEFVDLEYIEAAGGALCKIFRLTDAGRDRLAQLRVMADECRASGME